MKKPSLRLGLHAREARRKVKQFSPGERLGTLSFTAQTQ
jgi:hypothetical protein